jgi:uncharacterized membrane protein YcaP (DUF421 family)
LVFIIALAMLRLAGKRTFGKQSAADNVIMITLGALMSRAIVGVTAVLPVIAACFAIVLIHRFLAWLCLNHPAIGEIVKGKEISLYKNGEENKKNMQSTLISKEDMMEGMRLQVNSSALEEVSEIIVERNGEISVIKKK